MLGEIAQMSQGESMCFKTKFLPGLRGKPHWFWSMWHSSKLKREKTQQNNISSEWPQRGEHKIIGSTGENRDFDLISTMDIDKQLDNTIMMLWLKVLLIIRQLYEQFGKESRKIELISWQARLDKLLFRILDNWHHLGVEREWGGRVMSYCRIL